MRLIGLAVVLTFSLAFAPLAVWWMLGISRQITVSQAKISWTRRNRRARRDGGSLWQLQRILNS
jgi:hypothetical protein